MTQIINTAKECTVRTYMAAGFEGNLKVLIVSGEASDQELAEAFESIHEEYITLAGMEQSGDYILIKQIEYLQTRLKSIGNFIKINRVCMAEVGEPFYPALTDLKKLGHKIKWDQENPDPVKFLNDLKGIERKERRTESELLNKLRALEAFRQKSTGQAKSLKQQRIAFVSLLNRLGKEGFSIDKDKTSMEELGLMYKDFTAEMEAITNKRSK